jgi:uncharacterized protein (TIGR00251 family)
MSLKMLRAVAGGVTLAVRVQPGAKKTAVVGVYGEGAATQLKIAVQAPPIEGRANSAVVAFLADVFSLSRSNVELVSGESSRSKVFLLRGITLARAEARIETSQSKETSLGAKAPR